MNNKLGALDAASGVLQCVKIKYPDISVKPLWLEKLSRWDDARYAYLNELSAWRANCPDDTPPKHKVKHFTHIYIPVFVIHLLAL